MVLSGQLCLAMSYDITESKQRYRSEKSKNSIFLNILDKHTHRRTHRRDETIIMMSDGDTAYN